MSHLISHLTQSTKPRTDPRFGQLYLFMLIISELKHYSILFLVTLSKNLHVYFLFDFMLIEPFECSGFGPLTETFTHLSCCRSPCCSSSDIGRISTKYAATGMTHSPVMQLFFFSFFSHMSNPYYLVSPFLFQAETFLRWKNQLMLLKDARASTV